MTFVPPQTPYFFILLIYCLIWLGLSFGGTLLVQCWYLMNDDAYIDLGKVSGPLKGLCSKSFIRHIKDNNLKYFGKIWQRSFYDHVIRNERTLKAIREYILDNPINWEQDIENLLHQ